MPKKKATFQPTVRPDWAGSMDYIPKEEQCQIFQAILMFPSIDVPNSAFWNKTVKPDLQMQLETFIATCEKKAIGIRKRWGTQKGIDNYTDVLDMNTELQDKDTNEKDMIYIVKEKEKKKDKESDSFVSNLEKESLAKTQNQTDDDFDRFWAAYTPVRCSDGRVVPKGSKKETRAKFDKYIKAGVKADDIIDGAKKYLASCQANDRLSCGATVFLNQERWKDDWSVQGIQATRKAKSISSPDYVGEGSFLRRAEDDPFCADL